MTEQEVDLKIQVDELRKRVEILLDDHQDFRKVHISRRGPEGGRGIQGETGATGAPADPHEVAAIAAKIAVENLLHVFRYETQTAKFEKLIKEFESEIVALRAAMKFAIIEELKLSNILDEHGNAHSNLKGERGEDSHVQGPRGDSVTGPAGRAGTNGRDAKIAVGSVTSGETASATLREENGVQVLDFVLPRGERGSAGRDGADSQVPGPKGDSVTGERGPEGLPGLPCADFDKAQAITMILDLKKRGAI